MLTKLDIANQLYEKATFDPADPKSIQMFNDTITKVVGIYSELCLNFGSSAQLRADALDRLFDTVPEEGVDMLSRYRDMLGIATDDIVAKVIETLRLCMKYDSIPIHEKIVTLNIMRARGYIDAYKYFFQLGYNTHATLVQKAEICKFLYASGSELYIEKAQLSLLDFIKDERFTSNERFSLISDYVMKGKNNCIKSIYLNKSLVGDYETDEEFVKKLYIAFFLNSVNEIRDRLLAGRSLLSFKTLSEDERTLVNEEIFKICSCNEFTENQRGDACDSLLNFGLPEFVVKAKAILRDIGFAQTQRKTNDLLQRAKIFYNDSQNVHQVTDESLAIFAEKVASDPMNYTFENANAYALELMAKLISPSETDKRLKIRSSLRQVSQDVTTFTAYKMVTADIFTYAAGKISSLSDDDVNKSVLEGLLIDELLSMDETCASGHAIRFVLALSIIDNSIKFSFDKQISANVAARLNVYYHKSSDEIQSAITCALGRMADESELEIARKFRDDHIPLVKDELVKEFVPEFTTLAEFEKAFAEGIKDYNY